MPVPKLFMLLLGCRPKGRFTEQHDVFFGIANSLKELIPAIMNSWPEAGDNIHIDAWREVTSVNNFEIEVVLKEEQSINLPTRHLFFLNLGGYRKGEFEEFHYKLLTIAADPEEAIREAKQELFYKQTGFKGAASHIDEKYGIDTDDLFTIHEILHPDFLNLYSILIHPGAKNPDEIHLGYLPLWKIR